MQKSESEFQIIQRYFKKSEYSSAGIIKGIGDDAAVLDISDQSNLLISIDTLISGVHFPETTNPYNIAYKSLAVNLSDLAAMGATPAWFTLALSLPDTTSEWLTEFSNGLFDLAEQYEIDLIGGDTTQGPAQAALSITIQIAGYASDSNIMYRGGAQINDDIYVSGYLGDAAAGLLILSESPGLNNKISDYLITQLNRPLPRISLGQSIRQFSNACIDVSDGLLADLKHILDSSLCGAVINVDILPISNELKKTFNEDRFNLALGSGDDYELCFCVPEKYKLNIKSISETLNIPITKIGKIVKGNEIKCQFENKPYEYQYSGYEHFKKK